MKKAAGAVFLLVGAVLVAGGIDKKSGLNNFVADVQADESEGQNTAADYRKKIFDIKDRYFHSGNSRKQDCSGK